MDVYSNPEDRGRASMLVMDLGHVAVARARVVHRGMTSEQADGALAAAKVLEFFRREGVEASHLADIDMDKAVGVILRKADTLEGGLTAFHAFVSDMASGFSDALAKGKTRDPVLGDIQTNHDVIMGLSVMLGRIRDTLEKDDLDELSYAEVQTFAQDYPAVWASQMTTLVDAGQERQLPDM